ncbi:MAG: exo-alpha-sialidase [Nitrospirae bacterium]|nr:exo-alpha-sialidase [Nitrospirota bacterium]
MKQALKIILFSYILIYTSITSNAEVITRQPLMYSTPDEAPVSLYFNGKPGIAFYDNKGWLKLLWTGEETPETISLQAHPDVKNSYIDFSSGDGNLYLLWRPKTAVDKGRGNKHVLFSGSYDGGKTFTPPVQLDSGNGAFHPRRIEAGEKGLLYLLWLDERAGPYGVYLNRSTDYGKTWLKEDLKMNKEDGNLDAPFMAADGKRAWVGWLEQNNKERRLKMRMTEDGGETWSDEKELPVHAGRIYTPQFIHTDTGLFVMYFDISLGITLSLSKDNGITWEPEFVLPETIETGTGGFKIAHNSKGAMCVEWPGPRMLGEGKADIFISCSNDGGLSWSNKPVRLDTNTPRLTHSLSPQIAMDNDGRVVVVWQDTRNIRTNIYANYSLDSGQTWLDKDVILNKAKGKEISQFPSIATDGKGRFLITWEIGNDSPGERKYVLAYEELIFSKEDTVKKTSVDKTGTECPKLLYQPSRNICRERGLNKQPSKNSMEKKLIKRVEKYWKAYVKGKYKKGYDIMDPFYRANVPKEYFASNVGQIKYLEFNILKDSLKITENFARIKVEVTLEAKRFEVGNYKGSIPKTKKVFEEEWIWIDGDWYIAQKGTSGAVSLPEI